MTHSGIAVDVIGAGLDLIPQEKVRAVLTQFPRLAMKRHSRIAYAASFAGSRRLGACPSNGAKIRRQLGIRVARNLHGRAITN
jgi:hypothetical protein